MCEELKRKDMRQAAKAFDGVLPAHAEGLLGAGPLVRKEEIGSAAVLASSPTVQQPFTGARELVDLFARLTCPELF